MWKFCRYYYSNVCKVQSQGLYSSTCYQLLGWEQDENPHHICTWYSTNLDGIAITVGKIQNDPDTERNENNQKV